MRILLIEDDDVLAKVLSQALAAQHWVVDLATDGHSGGDYALGAPYDLILMDVGLPGLDGIRLCRKLREAGCGTPILLMTARDAPSERIRGLDAGADDYVSKPLDIEELRARIRALLRRSEAQRSPILQVEKLRLDPRSCEVHYGEKGLCLTPKEYSLLELLMRHPERVFSRGEIVEHLWSFDDPPLEESVKAHVKGLRQKLKAAGAVDWIENIYALGYRLHPHIQAAAATAATAQERYRQEMAGLWERYRDLMAERQAVLQEAATVLVEQGQIPEALRQQAAQAAHKLAGTLGMFERDAGSDLARQVEQMLEAKKLEPQLAQLVEQLGTCITGDAAALALPRPAARPRGAAEIGVLVVDDDPIFLAALPPMLAPWGICTSTLADARQSWEVLGTVAPDLVILDVEMPHQDGISLCRAIRENPDWQSLPVLFLTAHRDWQTIQRLFAVGADDYVSKPVVGAELLSRITSRLERLRLLAALSAKDPLSGLANQLHSSRILEAQIHKARAGQPFCLAILAIAGLRRVHLAHGHAAGRQILQRWGRLLPSTLSGDDILGYWGEGEFVVGLAMQRAQAEAHLALAIKALQLLVYTGADGGTFQVHFSCSIAEYPGDGLSVQSLYRSAATSVQRS